MQRFDELTRRGAYLEAAIYLDLVTKADQQRAADLARKLKAVLDRRLWVEPQELSPRPGGNPDDALPWHTDELGRIPTRTGLPYPVRMVRREGRGDDPRWVFTQGTVSQVDEWYGLLEDQWVRRWMPEPLLRPGPLDLMWWQWLAAPLLGLVAYGAGRILGAATRGLVGRLTRRTGVSHWTEVLLVAVRGPLVLACGLLVFAIGARYLALYEPGQRLLGTALRTLGTVALFWALYGVVGGVGAKLSEASWAKERPSAASVLALGTRVGTLAVAFLAVLAVLSELGFPVTSLLAGLGVGGIALALAAQKTVENVFGSVSILVDQPLRVGDLVLVDGIQGTVEHIGLRSTRIRTLERSVVTFPNGKLADMKIESLAQRDHFRFVVVLGLVYGTTTEQLRSVLDGADAVMRGHARTIQHDVSVRLRALGACSLDIEVCGSFSTKDATEFARAREEVLLALLALVERSGTRLAYPTQTVQVERT
jgi:MscS family membrane protein